MKIRDDEMTKLKNNLEMWIDFMQGKPVCLKDISALMGILKEGGIKL